MKQIYISLLLIAYMSNWLTGQVLILNNFQSGSNSCPLMEVRMSESDNDGFYTIAYCNHGNALATNVYIELELSDDAEILQSPYSVISMQNNLYRINLPNTLAAECLDFDIKIKLSNLSIINCTRVYIYPNDPCQAMVDYYISNNLGDIMGDDDSNGDNDDDDITISTIGQNHGQRAGIQTNPFTPSTINSIFEDNVMLSGTPVWIWDSLSNTNILTTSLAIRPNNNTALSTNIEKGADDGENNEEEIAKLVWSEYCKNNNAPTSTATTSAILGDRIPLVGIVNGFFVASNTVGNSENEGNTNLGKNNFENDIHPLEIVISPNPFNIQTTIEIVGTDFQNRTFTLLDATGKTIKYVPFQSPKITLQKENLAPGLYFYQIIKEGQLEQVGKLIVH